MVCMFVLFLVGFDRSQFGLSFGICKAVAALIHFFGLCIFSWTLIEGIQLLKTLRSSSLTDSESTKYSNLLRYVVGRVEKWIFRRIDEYWDLFSLLGWFCGYFVVNNSIYRSLGSFLVCGGQSHTIVCPRMFNDCYCLLENFEKSRSVLWLKDTEHPWLLHLLLFSLVSSTTMMGMSI